jgi:predicted dehydrogenase
MQYERLVDRADEVGLRATVVHNQVYYPPFVRARRLVESGRLGRLHGVSVRWLENNDLHDTHTPVVRREANAIRGAGEGPTPRAEADWANRIYTTVNEGARDSTGT